MITFRNKGLVDLRAITTFGVNSKETKSPIGQFGTGFKYAVAVALRLGATISVYRGLEKFEFTARQEKIRNDEFSIVYMNDTPLGFTTHLGHHWEPWQAFRELYCNMLDEGGEAQFGTYGPTEGETCVHLSGEVFDKVWEERHTVVLPNNMKPLHADDRMEIFGEPSIYLYYRGVRVAGLEKPAKHTFNVLRPLQLTEDRTLAYEYQARDAISGEVAKLKDKALLRRLLFTGRDTYEDGLHFPTWNEASEEFLGVINKGRASQDLNSSAYGYFRTKNPQVALPKKVSKVQVQERRDLKSAVKLCALLGYDVAEYPVVITSDLPDDVLGCVYRKHSDKIFLSRRVFTQGLNMITGTLLEEYLHLKYGLDDNTRALQNHLLDALVRAGQRLQLSGVIVASPDSSAAPLA